MVRSADVHGRVNLGLDGVQWGVLDQVVDASIFLRAAEVRAPEMADSELVEPKHVGDRYLTDDSAVELGSLVSAGSDECTTI